MKLKKFSAAALAALTVTMMSAAPVLAADDIEVNEDISVSGDYDWTRFAGDHITLNVYNNGLYISDGSDESVNVLSAFEELPGIKVIKTSAVDGSPVENAVYSIEGVTCAFSTSVSTGPDGSALVEDLPAGVYIVREESVP